MSVLSKHEDVPTGPASAHPIIVAEAPALRSELQVAMSAAGVPLELVARPEALPEYEIGPSTVLIFACDIDRPTDMTALRRLRREHPAPAIVVVAPRSTAIAVRRTLDAGADAIVFEPEIEVALVASVRAVESGQSVVPRNVRAGVERPNLSHRERQVLNLVCEGHTNAEIAEALFLAESTIKSHMASIFTKLGVHSRREARAAFIYFNSSTAGPPSQAEQW